MTNIFLENCHRETDTFKIKAPGSYGVDRVLCYDNKDTAIADAKEMSKIFDEKYSCTHENGYYHIREKSIINMFLPSDPITSLIRNSIEVYEVKPSHDNFSSHSENLIYEEKLSGCIGEVSANSEL